jgi:hypothetical protein
MRAEVCITMKVAHFLLLIRMPLFKPRVLQCQAAALYPSLTWTAALINNKFLYIFQKTEENSLLLFCLFTV